MGPKEPEFRAWYMNGAQDPNRRSLVTRPKPATHPRGTRPQGSRLPIPATSPRPILPLPAISAHGPPVAAVVVAVVAAVVGGSVGGGVVVGGAVVGGSVGGGAVVGGSVGGGAVVGGSVVGGSVGGVVVGGSVVGGAVVGGGVVGGAIVGGGFVPGGGVVPGGAGTPGTLIGSEGEVVSAEVMGLMDSIRPPTPATTGKPPVGAGGCEAPDDPGGVEPLPLPSDLVCGVEVCGDSLSDAPAMAPPKLVQPGVHGLWSLTLKTSSRPMRATTVAAQARARRRRDGRQLIR